MLRLVRHPTGASMADPPTRARPAATPSTDPETTELGVIAAGHVATVEAAAAVLRAGGNAFDAVVAAGFAAGVAEPCLSSLGGGGFLLARTAVGEEVLFDFFVETPGRGRPVDAPAPELDPVTLRFRGADQVFHVGHGSVAVPGCLAGYLHVHRRLGSLELAQVVAPARRLAAEGVILGPDQAAIVRLLEPIFSRTPTARQWFVPEGRPFADDEEVVNAPLAAFLDRIGRGEVTGFGDPSVAGPIVADMEAGGGSLTAEDLAAYQVVERDPLVVTPTGARLVTNPPPSYGGTVIGRALSLLEEAGSRGPFGSGPRLRQLADVLDGVSREHLGLGPRAAKGTTHVSVADAAGNLASMTTSNGSGSGITLGETGVLANNIMGEADLHPGGFHLDEPGVRVGSMMAPSILFREGAAPVALGSGGSERIRSAMTQVIANLLDHGMSLPEAIRAPRIHVTGDTVQVEPGFVPDAIAELAAGFAVNVWSVTDLYFGGVHAVSLDGDRAGDHRRGGRTAVLRGASPPRQG
jgi:gamma-glutamyltranspeptidase / glutathione hydrolase